MKRRGVSEVTGSVIMLGIVGSIAALVLTLGLSSVYNFNTFLVDVDVQEDVLKENFIVEFVEFEVNGSSNDVILTVRNTGLTDITIDIISIVAIDAQTFIAHQIDTAKVIQPRTKDTITVDTSCPTFVAADACLSVNYRITLTTVRGNIYDIEAIPLRA